MHLQPNTEQGILLQSFFGILRNFERNSEDRNTTVRTQNTPHVVIWLYRTYTTRTLQFVRSGQKQHLQKRDLAASAQVMVSFFL